MTHFTQNNQGQNGKAIDVVFNYRYFVTDGSGIYKTNNFSVMEANVALNNGKIIVLDDAMFTKVSIDEASCYGLPQLNVPLLFLNIASESMGTGFNFSLSTDKRLNAYELQEIITTEFAKKVKPLTFLKMPAIDDALIRDALKVSEYELAGV